MPNPLYDTLFRPMAGSDRAFLILPDGGTLSAGAFLDMVHRAANALSDCSIAPGDRVAVQVAKSPMALALYGAAVAAGAVFLPLNPAYTPSEVDYFIGNATPKLLLADPDRTDALAPVAAEHRARLMTLDSAGGGGFADLAARQSQAFAPAAREDDDLAALLYTSGTTGRSKGAMLSHRNLLSNAEVLTGAWRFSAADVLLHALPIFHTHGLFVATNIALLSRSAMIFLPGFDTDAILRMMPQATVMMGVPTFYTRLLADPRLTRELTARMRLFVSGSAPLLAGTHADFESRTGHRILERYGMTETNMNTSNPYDGTRVAGTVGPALPGVEIRVCDPDAGTPLEAGATGMVEVRGPNVFRGYWQMPEKTAAELRPDGFFITGDLGVLDEHGYLSIVGRSKDLIISGGFNIYPREIEAVLDQLPDVLESAVIGVPHPDLGEAALGILVPRPGHVIDLEATAHELRGRLARFKQPRAMEVVPDLPRNTMGKVQKALLRQRFAERFV